MTMTQRLALTRELRAGHTLSVEQFVEGRRSKASDTIRVSCTCGDVGTIASLGELRSALNLAERNHRLYGPTAIGFDDIPDFHGTPNGFANYECRCDPCTWAWASYRRGDDPVEAVPVWFDDWLATAGAV